MSFIYYQILLSLWLILYHIQLIMFILIYYYLEGNVYYFTAAMQLYFLTMSWESHWPPVCSLSCCWITLCHQLLIHHTYSIACMQETLWVVCFQMSALMHYYFFLHNNYLSLKLITIILYFKRIFLLKVIAWRHKTNFPLLYSDTSNMKYFLLNCYLMGVIKNVIWILIISSTYIVKSIFILPICSFTHFLNSCFRRVKIIKPCLPFFFLNC